jgi:hypothetical protein
MVDWSGSSTQASSEVFVFIRAFLPMSRSRRSQLPTTYRWIDDPDLWIRRTAIIAQVQHKGATDGRTVIRLLFAPEG